MAHHRSRILEGLIRKSLGWSPIVGVLGARQAGKTTLLKAFSKQYGTFDRPELEADLEASGGAFLEGAAKPLFLDEVQKYPPIFDLLKLAVDEKRRPGQYLITGSVRFSAKKQIRESLTGRAIVWELLPLTLSECFSKPFDNVFKVFAKKGIKQSLEALEKRAWCTPSQWRQYAERGGMPGFCFLRDASQRGAAAQSLLETVIERDYYYLRPSKIRASVILEFLRELSLMQGDPVRPATLAKKYRLSAPTVKAILETLEGLFLVRAHGRTFYLEDVGISSLLARGNSKPRTAEMLLFSQLKAFQKYFKEEQVSLSAFSTRGGAFVPFVLESKGNPPIAFTVDEGGLLPEKALKSLYAVQRQMPSARLVHVQAEGSFSIYKDKILRVPLGAIY